MKKKEIKELSNKSKKELFNLLLSLRKELKNIEVEKNAGKLKNTAIIGKKKKEVARILTALNNTKE